MAKKKRVKRKGVRRKVVRRGGPRRSATVLESSEAAANLQAMLAGLTSQRDALDRQINAIRGALNAFGGGAAAAAAAAPAGRAGRQYRRGSLKEYIEQAMRGKGVMAVKDIADGVVKAGYKSKNKTLAKSVGIALTQMPSISKVGRGRFKLA